MNNIQSYNEYLNEGLFGSKYKDFINKLYNILSEIDIDDVEYRNDIYTIIIKEKNINKRDVDPYGEENWGIDDVEIKVGGDIKGEYHIHINHDLLDCKSFEARKIYKLLEYRYENRKQEKKEERINKIIKNFQR